MRIQLSQNLCDLKYNNWSEQHNNSFFVSISINKKSQFLTKSCIEMATLITLRTRKQQVESLITHVITDIAAYPSEASRLCLLFTSLSLIYSCNWSHVEYIQHLHCFMWWCNLPSDQLQTTYESGLTEIQNGPYSLLVRASCFISCSVHAQFASILSIDCKWRWGCRNYWTSRISIFM